MRLRRDLAPVREVLDKQVLEDPRTVALMTEQVGEVGNRNPTATRGVGMDPQRDLLRHRP